MVKPVSCPNRAVKLTLVAIGCDFQVGAFVRLFSAVAFAMGGTGFAHCTTVLALRHRPAFLVYMLQGPFCGRGRALARVSLAARKRGGTRKIIPLGVEFGTKTPNGKTTGEEKSRQVPLTRVLAVANSMPPHTGIACPFFTVDKHRGELKLN